MIHQPKPDASDSVIDELHRIRRAISEKFGGDVAAIARDAAERLAQSGRRVWVPGASAEVPQTSVNTEPVRATTAGAPGQ